MGARGEMTPSGRLTPERLQEIRDLIAVSHITTHFGVRTVAALIAELDAVTRERDEARANERVLIGQRTELARKLREFGVEAYLT